MVDEFNAVELSRVIETIQSSLDLLPDEKLSEALKSVVTNEIKKQIQITDKSPLHLLSVEAIAETEWPEPEWAVEGILPTGLGMLAGRPKIGKSRLSNQLGFSVAGGTPFLRHPTSQGSVAIFALEDTPHRIKRMIVKHNWPTNLPIEYLLLGEFEGQIGKLDGEGLDRFERQLNHKKYRLVVIDTVSRAFRGEQNDVGDMTNVLTPLQEMAHRYNCCILLVDHHRKRGNFNPDKVDDILGSTAKSAIPDTIWGLIRETGKPVKLHVTGRDVKESTIRLSKDKDSGFWTLEGKDEPIFMTQPRTEIVSHIEDHPDSTAAEIANGIGQDRGNAHRRLQDLVHTGVIEKSNKGGKKVYRISENGYR